MPILHHDYETRSVLDIEKVGAWRYSLDSSTDVWGCAYAVDDGPVEWWTPGDPVPEPFILAAQDPAWLTCAYNDTFERLITRHITGPRYGFPLVPIERRRCLQASSLALALPGRLDKVAKALSLEPQKDAAGHRIMLQMARPRKPRKDEDPAGIYWIDDPDKRESLAAYSRIDVEVERALYHRIGLLPEDEQELWRLDSIINDRGIHLDHDLIEAAIGVSERVKPALREELVTLTGGLVVSLDQHVKLKAWLNANGCPIEDIQAETVEKALKGNSIDASVRRVLELRRDGAHAAAHKYRAMRAWRADDGRAHGTFRFHGASTGRWSAHGIQLQNLKRPDDIDDIGIAIELVRAGDIEGIRRAHSSPLQVVGNVVRGAVAAADGRELIAGDLSGAESRVTAWLCGETWKLEQWAKFDESGKPEDEPYYINGVAFGLSPEIARGPGKTSDLAFGYGGSIPAWRNLAPDDKSSDELILSRRNMWQAKHPMTVRFWGQINRAAIRAVHKPGTVRRCGRLAFETVGDFLFMSLPSGRRIAYPFPRLVENARGDLAVVYKDNQKGRWVDCRGGDGAYHGTWMENAVSGIARDLFAQAMPRLEACGYPIIIHVHDEIGAEVPIGFGSNEEFRRLLIELPAWATGLPLSAKVRRGPRFCKIGPPKAASSTPPPPPPPPPRMDNGADTNDGGAGMTGNGAHASRSSGTYTSFDKGSGQDADAGKPYAPVRARLSERGYRLAKSFPFVLPGEKEPLFFEDRYEKAAKNGGKKDKECRFRHVENGVELTDTGPRRILYGLPQLVKAGLSTPVFITEGAAKCDPLIAAGLVAVAAPYHTFKYECAAALAGRNLVYLEDHDLPDPSGRIAAKEFSGRAQRQLSGLAASFRIVPAMVLWKGLGRSGEPPHGWDVKDWIADGGKAKKLVELADQQGARESFEVSNAADLQRQEFAATRFIVPGYVAEGVTLFAGKPKIGKSWLALHACWAVATGGTTLGNIQVEQGDAIYAALEDNPRRMKGRMEKLFGKTPWPCSLEFVYRMKKLKEGGVAELRGWIEAKKNPKLVVIDTLKMVRTAAAKGQSYYEADYEAVVELRELAAEFGVAIIVIHHQRKAEADDLFDTVSGTLGLTGAVDTIMILDRSGGGTILAARGRDIEEINQAVEFDNGAWRIIGNADFVRVSGERKQILEVMEEAKGEPLSAHQIARAIGGKANSVTALLRKMVKEGMVAKSGYGKFVLDLGL